MDGPLPCEKKHSFFGRTIGKFDPLDPFRGGAFFILLLPYFTFPNLSFNEGENG
jgi:hypothetical protein